ncbi:hypothetical protein [uncultured Rikenella sp.]|uniref:hypothetical protein n=1 Tax=uncultured Rikenella sp. TaxID=368003 RepID=UPI0026266A2D|nr:hypothetical protein [uncultured Rikenella sp.]
MKKHLKKIVGCTFAAVLGLSAYLSYRQAQPAPQISDLTLANIEALGYLYDNEGRDKVGRCDPPWNCLCDVDVFNNGYPGKPADNSGGPIPVEFPGIFYSN